MVDPAIRRAARLELARREFWSYCKLMTPDFYREERPYLKELCTRLQAFCESDCKVMVVNMPPRHGKSSTAAGLGARKLIIDDLIKKAEEAFNENAFEKQWQWFTRYHAVANRDRL